MTDNIVQIRPRQWRSAGQYPFGRLCEVMKAGLGLSSDDPNSKIILAAAVLYPEAVRDYLLRQNFSVMHRVDRRQAIRDIYEILRDVRYRQRISRGWGQKA
jgi:hypothetical protein